MTLDFCCATGPASPRNDLSEGPENETVVRCFYVGSAFVPQASCTGFHLFCFQRSFRAAICKFPLSSNDMNCKHVKLYYIGVGLLLALRPCIECSTFIYEYMYMYVHVYEL